jgi:hypothetical protein
MLPTLAPDLLDMILLNDPCRVIVQVKSTPSPPTVVKKLISPIDMAKKPPAGEKLSDLDAMAEAVKAAAAVTESAAISMSRRMSVNMALSLLVRRIERVCQLRSPHGGEAWLTRGRRQLLRLLAPWLLQAN